MPLKRELAHLDGDIIVYRCGFAVEQRPVTLVLDNEQIEFDGIQKARKWVKENLPPELREDVDYWYVKHHHVEPESHALQAVDTQIRGILDDLHKITGKKHRPVVYLTSGRSFREKVATIRPYKGNRDDKHQPVHKAAITQYLIDKYDAQVTTELEADDLLAINGMQGGVVCSIDKDLLQVPCKHYDWTRGLFLNIEELDSHYNLWSQILMGDSTDNIVGVPGIGAAKAYKILDEAEHQTPKGWARIVHEVYREAWNAEKKPWEIPWKAALHETGKLVYLLRHPEDSWESYYESITGV